MSKQIQWIETRIFSKTLKEIDPEIDADIGYYYSDGAYIELLLQSGMFHVHIGIEEHTFEALQMAEEYLWDNHSKYNFE